MCIFKGWGDLRMNLTWFESQETILIQLIVDGLMDQIKLF